MQMALDFPRALVRRSDPMTSHKAADKMDGSGATKRQAEICLEAVRKKPGLTAAEIAQKCGLERHKPSRRLPALRDEGLVCNYYRGSEWANIDKEKARDKYVRVCRVTGSKSMTWWPA